MKIKEPKATLIFLMFLAVFFLLMLFKNIPSITDIKANRYSHCIERQSEIGKLEYEEMKEVCSEYLK